MDPEELNHCDHVIHPEGECYIFDYYTSDGINYLSENYKDGTAIKLEDCQGGYDEYPLHMQKSDDDEVVKIIIYLFIIFIILLLYTIFFTPERPLV